MFKFEDLEGNGHAILDSRFKANHDAGNIPTSINLPFTLMFNQDKSFKSPDEMRDILEHIGALEDATGQPVITSC